MKNILRTVVCSAMANAKREANKAWNALCKPSLDALRVSYVIHQLERHRLVVHGAADAANLISVAKSLEQLRKPELAFQLAKLLILYRVEADLSPGAFFEITNLTANLAFNLYKLDNDKEKLALAEDYYAELASLSSDSGLNPRLMYLYRLKDICQYRGDFDTEIQRQEAILSLCRAFLPPYNLSLLAADKHLCELRAAKAKREGSAMKSEPTS